MTFRKVDAAGNVYYTSADQEFSQENKKVLTLYGPPGTGKSTMARVLAKQCGYETRVINASDMRSPAALIDAMKNAMTQDAHFGEGREKQKPVLLVVDEVDGALCGGAAEGSGGFRMVCDYLKKCIDSSIKGRKKPTEEESEENDDQDDDMDSDGEGPQNRAKKVKAKNKGRKDSDYGFRRPIIFICNDLYSKALKPLRELSIQVKIPDADPARLLQRMRQIIKLENAKVSDSVLQDLIKMNKSDARATINGLQFLTKMKLSDPNNASITLEEFREKFKKAGGDNQGTKDTFTNIFEVANQILYDRPKNMFGSTLLQLVKKTATALGDHQLLNDCLYENYNWCTHYLDDSLEKTAYFLDQLSRADIEQRFVYRT